MITKILSKDLLLTADSNFSINILEEKFSELFNFSRLNL